MVDGVGAGARGRRRTAPGVARVASTRADCAARRAMICATCSATCRGSRRLPACPVRTARWVSSRAKSPDGLVGQRPQGVERVGDAHCRPACTRRSSVVQALSVHRPPCRQRGVQAAALVAAQFHGDVGVAERLQPVADLLAQLRVQQPVHLGGVHFQAGDRVVVADADLPEAQIVAQEILGGVQPLQEFRGDARAVGEARRQAGQGGLVPGRQAELFGQVPDLGFGQPDFQQRARGRRTPARPAGRAGSRPGRRGWRRRRSSGCPAPAATRDRWVNSSALQ